jgi:hypothetical protein
VKSGITKVSPLLCILALTQGGSVAPRLDLPQGFAASVYAQGLSGARNLTVLANGTLRLEGRTPEEIFEIAPQTADAPVTVMRVASGLDAPDAPAEATVAVHAPSFARMHWNAQSGELAYGLPRAASTGIPVAPRTLRLARLLASRHPANVALGPDGALFVADSRAGEVWRIRPTAL